MGTRPVRESLIIVLGAAVGALLVGFAASTQPVILGLDFAKFHPSLSLLFLAAVAQLFLAAAVLFQIHTSNRTLAEEAKRRRSAQLEREADAMIEFVGRAANASAVYGHALSALRSVAANPGNQSKIDAAKAELDQADGHRQSAHAARFRVRAYSGVDSEADRQAEAFLNRIDDQRVRGYAVVRWSENPNRGTIYPEPRRVVAITQAERDACLQAASNVLAGRPS